MFQKTNNDTSMKHIQKNEDFYQSKYDYYRQMSICAVIFSVIASNFYWISDCQLFNRIAIETLFPRLFMLIPLGLYIIISNRVENYKIMVPLSYIMLHGIMWCTIWSIYYLPIKQHANEGFIIMHLMFLALGFCAPIKLSIIFHSLLIFDIIISYPINHYENIDLMMTLGIPALIAVEFMLYMTEKSYIDQYSYKLKLQNLSYYDQLTKVYNRNKLQQLCIKDSNYLLIDDSCILIMDIDFFKEVNDKYGHVAGDTVLISLANIVQSNTKTQNDYVIRWGGEEFVVILSHCKLKEAINISENIRKEVENHNNGICSITISIGVVRYDGQDYLNSIKHADQALYYAKQHGRNKVCVYDNGTIY